MVPLIRFYIFAFRQVREMKRENEIFIVFISICFAFLCLGAFLKPQEEYSVTERRKLAQFPKLSKEVVFAGDFMKEFESYGLDQFPFRDRFRSLKAWTSLKKDENGIYMAKNHIVSMEYPLKEQSLLYASKKFRNIYDNYLKQKGCKVYLSVIPDKNYFYAKKEGYLSLDYERIVSVMQEENSYMNYIDIFKELSGEDYYKTDTHWRQERLVPVKEKLLKEMGVEVLAEYEVESIQQPFYGVLYGQAALAVEPDNINYLTNERIEKYKVWDGENSREIPVYDLEKTTGKDPYEMFLGGPLSLITIENEQCENQRQLIVFRDSFGSSIAPLLAEGYSKTTLIDIRYLQSNLLGQFVEFENADVLFLYSTLVLNNSETLK